VIASSSLGDRCSLVTLAFFLILVIFFENPFARIWSLPNGTAKVTMFQPLNAVLVRSPPDGQGLNPLLRPPRDDRPSPMLYLDLSHSSSPLVLVLPP